jgi:hypothetical protein
MDTFELILIPVVLGLVVYFFIVTGSDEMKPNDPDIAFDKSAPRVYGPSIAERGYTRWMDLMQGMSQPEGSKRPPRGKKNKKT